MRFGALPDVLLAAPLGPNLEGCAALFCRVGRRALEPLPCRGAGATAAGCSLPALSKPRSTAFSQRLGSGAK